MDFLSQDLLYGRMLFLNPDSYDLKDNIMAIFSSSEYFMTEFALVKNLQSNISIEHLFNYPKSLQRYIAVFDENKWQTKYGYAF